MLTDFIYNLSILVMILALIMVIMGVLLPIRYGRITIMVLFYSIIIAISIFAFFAEPGKSSDLAIFYESISGIKYGYIVNQGDEALIVWKIILKIIALTDNYGYLPFLFIIMWGILVGKILNHYMLKNMYQTKTIMLYFIALFSGCSMYYMISGIRNTFVCALVFFGYYFYYQKKKSIYYFIVVVASLIHIFAIILFLLIEIFERMIKRNENNKLVKLLIVVLVISLLIRTDIPFYIFETIPGGYGDLLENKWQDYVVYSKILSPEKMIQFIWMGYLLYFSIKNFITRSKVMLADWLIVIAFALSPMIIFFERMIYFIGIASLPIINEAYYKINKRYRYLYVCASFVVFATYFLFTMYSMFAHIRFNGNDYHSFWKGLFFFVQ